MRIGMSLPTSTRSFHEAVEQLVDFERAGLDIVFVPEAYTFDAVSQMGYIAAKTSRVEIASSILNIYSRTPTLLGMTAAGLDAVSQGRFSLGIGASGPQVVEGFHGVPYDAPLARTREVVDICRQVWRREPVQHEGRYYQLPLDAEHGGTGLGKALKLINHPVRSRIPLLSAAIGPKNVALAAEIFEGWQPIFYFPERAEEAFGDALAVGNAKRDPALGPLEILADTHLAFVDSPAQEHVALQRVREHLALYVGGMGARGKNFYNALAVRYGYADDAAVIQNLYLSGRKDEAAAAVPDELAHGVSLIGSEQQVATRLAAFAASGATTVSVMALAATHEERVKDISRLSQLCSQFT